MHEALPLEGERVVETLPRKHRCVHEALSLEDKCDSERGTMPRGSPSEGKLTTSKGTTPGELEGDLPWDPGGEENVEHEVNAPSWESRSRTTTRKSEQAAIGSRHTRVTRGHAHPARPECATAP